MPHDVVDDADTAGEAGVSAQDHVPAPRDQGGLVLAFGMSLALCGWLATIVAAWWMPQEMVAVSPDEVLLRVSSVVAGGVLGLWAIREITTRIEAGKIFAPPQVAPVVPPLLAALAFMWLAVWAVAGLLPQLSAGWAGYNSTASIVGALAGIIGVILVLAIGRRRPRMGARKIVGAVLVSLVVVGGGTVATVRWAPDVTLKTTTAASGGQTAPIPEALSEVAWTTEMPSSIHDVLQAGPGVIVAVRDGVIALDGENGDERWRYQRSGASVSDIKMSPDGRTIVLQWNGDGSRMQFVFLDAETGEELHRLERELGSSLHSFVMPMGADVYVGTSVPDRFNDEEEGDGDRTVTGYDLRSGEERWSYSVSKDCVLAEGFGDIVAKGPVIVPLKCGAGDAWTSVRFAAFGDGPEPLWEREIEAESPLSRSYDAVAVWTPQDGSSFNVRFVYGDDEHHQDHAFGLDLETGDDVPVVGESDDTYDAWFPDYQVTETQSEDDLDVIDVRDRSGKRLGTATVDAHLTAVTPSDSFVAYFDRSEQVDGSEFRVHTTTYAGAHDTIEIDFHRDTEVYVEDWELHLLRAPGAWVTWTDAPTAEGERPVIIGLR